MAVYDEELRERRLQFNRIYLSNDEQLTCLDTLGQICARFNSVVTLTA
jgi:hypothetical protein